MVDGWRPDVITVADTPTIDGLWARSAYSLEARVEDTTISGSGQSTFVTGVHRDKHGVDDNSFSGANYEEYPYWFRLLDEAAPELQTAAYHTWRPMYETALGGDDGADWVYYWDYGDDDGDARTTTQLQLDVLTQDLDAIVWMLSDLDTNGHAHGFSPAVVEYVDAMELIDDQIGLVLEALKSRPSYLEEDWMIIVSTDHAGSGRGHGDNVPEHRLVPLFIHGGDAVPGPIWPAPNTVSIVPTALAHLGVAVEADWGLDGTAVGFEPTAPPAVALERNVIVNGDAEMERGFDGFLPDAALPGWVDPGYSTATLYGSSGFPSLTDAGPDDRGNSFLCGGDASRDSSIWQDIDLADIAAAIDTGSIGYRLSGWLGGYSDQNDRARVTVDMYDLSGAVVASETLPPVTDADRDDTTGLALRTRFGMVPPFVRSVRVTVDFLHSSGGNDGYVDNLELVFTEGK